MSNKIDIVKEYATKHKNMNGSTLVADNNCFKTSQRQAH